MIRTSGHPSSRNRVRRLTPIAVLVLTFFCQAGMASAARPDPPEDPEAFLVAPTQLVAETLEEIISVLQDPKLSPETRREKIEALAFAVFDFKTMSKLVLARNWKKLDAGEREEFVDQFKVYLSRNYGSRLDRFRQTEVVIFGARLEPRNDVTVFSAVADGEYAGVKLDYRLRQRNGQWGVIDVVIEGVSLVANFRSQFREILSRKGPKALIAQLRKKNQQLSSDSSDEAAAESGS
ncbi:ABC transporter substrate-binding protein [Myxococcota bacterium]|nr:ABC transporter substrate-binding protein [Myxococcota bacterium]